MFRIKSVDAYSCGEPGDLYAWNASSWKNEQSNSTVKITQHIKQLVCANKDVLILPSKSFSESLKACSEITGGKMYYEDHDDFLKIPRSKAYITKWLPFTDEAGEGSFMNIYSNAPFNMSLFAPGEPKGGNKCNFLYWYSRNNENRGYRECANSKHKSLCENSMPSRSMKIRGLCSSSFIDKEYRPTMHPDGKTIVWIGIGENTAIIQYSKMSRGFILKSLKKLAYAQINISNSVELIGKHEWTIFNDTGCSPEFSYAKDVSFRYCRRVMTY